MEIVKYSGVNARPVMYWHAIPHSIDRPRIILLAAVSLVYAVTRLGQKLRQSKAETWQRLAAGGAQVVMLSTIPIPR